MEQDASARENDGRMSRALVPVDEVRPPAPGVHARPLATFIAQLLACQTRVAEFRKRRRAQPRKATALYGRGPAAPRSRFERVL